MARDPYARIAGNPYWAKTAIESQVVAVLDLATQGRDMTLIATRTRALKRTDIHELVLTRQSGLVPGDTVRDVVYLAFVEITGPGVLVAGDRVFWRDTQIGVLAGFDETHCPNHYNIIISSPAPQTGRDLGLALGDTIVFRAE